VLLLIQFSLAGLTAYLAILTLFAWKAERKTDLLEDPSTRFLILIPAHNEERLLPNLLESLRSQQYPRSQYSIHVVADNCTDQTAAIARQYAIVHERTDNQQRGKGYALQWLLQRIWASGEMHDGLVFLDADSLVSPNFLAVMAARLHRGEKAVQAYYAVQNPASSWAESLRFTAFAALHYLRPQGRMLLGGSAGLKGNGMVFPAEIPRVHSWSASITEDMAYHMSVILAGERVTVAPDAIVYGEMPSTLARSQAQHARWEQGRLEMARHYLPKLLSRAWALLQRGKWRDAFIFFDAGMEHLIPPFSVLTASTCVSLALSIGIFWLTHGFASWIGGEFDLWINALAYANLYLAASLLLGQIFYILSSLVMVRAPRLVYRNLLYSPILIIWKMVHYLKVWRRPMTAEWVRTARNEG